MSKINFLHLFKLIFFILISIVSFTKSDLTIHVIPHSHIDPGWLETYDRYYFSKVVNIYNSVLDSLIKNKNRTFVICEIIYFKRWYDDLPIQNKQLFKEVLSENRIEFVLGGLVMNDEANCYFSDIIDNIRYGKQFLYEEFGVVPKTGWYLDPFGHSAGNAAIMSLLDYDQLVLCRIHNDYLPELKKSKSTEFIWEPFNKVSYNKKILTHMLPIHYGHIGYLRFQHKPDKTLPSLIENYVRQFLISLKDAVKGLLHSQFLYLYGDDFTFFDGERMFLQMEDIIKFVNEVKNNSLPDLFEGNITIKYSTPEKYFKSIQEELKSKNIWFNSIKNKDFYPYKDYDHAYWAGYFTSRPFLKGYAKKGSNLYFSFSKYYSLNKFIERKNNKKNNNNENNNKWENIINYLDQNRKMVALTQHHDAITGTSTERVSTDYVNILKISINKIEEDFKVNYEDKLGLKIGKICYNNYIVDAQTCSDEFTIKEKDNEKNEIDLGLINPSIKGEVLINIEITESKCNYKVIGIDSDFFCIDYPSFEDISTFNYPNRCFLNFFYKFNENENYAYIKIKKMINEPVYSGIKIDFDQKVINLLSNQNKIKTLNLIPENYEFFLEYYYKDDLTHKLNFIYSDGLFHGTSKSKECSDGAYLFCPENRVPERIKIDRRNSFYIKGKISLIIVTRNQDTSFSIFTMFYKPFFAKVEHLFDDFSQSKYYTQTFSYGFVFKTDINNTNINNNPIFYTDSNGMEMIKRVVDEFDFTPNPKGLIGSNFYPITTAISLKDEQDPSKLYPNRVTIYTDRSQGGSGILPGALILIVQKKSLNSDNRGMGEPIIENDSFRRRDFKVTHFIEFGVNINKERKESKHPYNFKSNFISRNFFYNYFNTGIILFKILDNLNTDKSIKQVIQDQNKLIFSSFYKFIKISDDIISHYQVATKNLVIGEYYKTYNDYFYKDDGENFIQIGIISLRFPRNSGLKVTYDKGGYNYLIKNGTDSLNDNMKKKLKEPNDLDIYLKNNEVVYIYYYFD